MPQNESTPKLPELVPVYECEPPCSDCVAQGMCDLYGPELGVQSMRMPQPVTIGPCPCTLEPGDIVAAAAPTDLMRSDEIRLVLDHAHPTLKPPPPRAA